jgi:hypothetical protein
LVSSLPFVTDEFFTLGIELENGAETEASLDIHAVSSQVLFDHFDKRSPRCEAATDRFCCVVAII